MSFFKLHIKPYFTNLNICLGFALLFFSISFFTNLKRSENIFGIDLRNRIIGARLLGNTENLFQYKYTETTPPQFIDPLDTKAIEVNRVTVTPTFLYLLKPLALLDYHTITKFWFYFQYGILLSIILLITKQTKDNILKKQIIIISIVFIGSSGPWLTHLYVAQNYILYPFFLTLVFLLYQSSIKHNIILAGILMGIVIFLRLPFILLLLPFLIYKKKNFIIGSTIGITIGLLFTISVGQLKDWKNYNAAMKIHGQMQLSPISTKKIITPSIIEGVIFNDAIIDLNNQYSNNHNLSLQRFANDFFALKIQSNVLTILLVISSILLLVFFRYLNREPNLHQLFIVGFILIMISEYLIPAPRYSYNYVQWIFPIGLFLLTYKNFSVNKFLIGLGIIGLFLNLPLGNSFIFKSSLGELILLFALFLWASLAKKITYSKVLD